MARDFLQRLLWQYQSHQRQQSQTEGRSQGAQRIGQLLAVAALDALKKGDPLALDRFGARSVEVTCRLRRPRPEDIKQAEAMLKDPKNPAKNAFGFNELYAPAALVLARTKDREHRAEIAALRLGGFALTWLPGEIFVELGQEVQDASPFKQGRTIGLTNGSMGYIPTRRGFVEGGYEAGYRSARYEPETGHTWVKTAVGLLKELAK